MFVATVVALVLLVAAAELVAATGDFLHRVVFELRFRSFAFTRIDCSRMEPINRRLPRIRADVLRPETVPDQF